MLCFDVFCCAMLGYAMLPWTDCPCHSVCVFVCLPEPTTMACFTSGNDWPSPAELAKRGRRVVLAGEEPSTLVNELKEVRVQHRY